MHRRTFLKSAIAATVAAPAYAGEQQRIVDTHVHLWDLNRLRLPWIDKQSPLARSYVVKDFESAIQGLNIVKGVYMEVDVDPRDLVAEAEFVLELCRQGTSPLAGAVIGGRPAADDFAAYLGRFRGNRFLKGVRQVLHTPATKAGYCLAPAFVRGVRLLGEQGLSFDLCMRPTDLGDAVKLIEACPDTRFILDHCGNGPVYAAERTQWQRDIERLAHLRNIDGKISGIVVQARPKWTADDLAPVINHCLDSFGPERVLFAGDWPVCTLRATYRQWVDALKAIVRNRPGEQRQKLFHDNALRVYRLPQ